MANGVAVFDTFSIGESLGKVFDKSQTKAIIEAISASRADPETVSKAELREHKAEAKAEKAELKANIEQHESKILHAISDLRKDIDSKFAAIDSKFAAIDSKFAAIDSKLEISHKHAESLVDKAKFHLLSWMIALTLGPTVFRNLWQFLSITGVSH